MNFSLPSIFESMLQFAESADLVVQNLAGANSLYALVSCVNALFE
jgi:hypothetical protein